jgi:hypothetical protein
MAEIKHVPSEHLIDAWLWQKIAEQPPVSV